MVVKTFNNGNLVLFSKFFSLRRLEQTLSRHKVFHFRNSLTLILNFLLNRFYSLVCLLRDCFLALVKHKIGVV